jgi:3-oxoadipate enol-lactonase
MTEPRAVVERYLTAFGGGNIDAAMACVHPDAIWRIDGDPIVGTVGIIKGRDAVRAWQMRFPESFRPLDFSVDRLIAEDADVIALGGFRHHVMPTNAIIDSGYAIRFTIRDGLIARYQIFEDSLLIARAFTSGTAARSATINGAAYAWDDLGQGAPTLFLHGLFLDRSFWSHQVSALSQSHRCIAFDMPGHGASGWRPGLDLDGIAEDIALWIGEHCSEPVTIVGHSQGGMIAMRLAARHTRLIERLVLVNTSARAEYPERLDGWRVRRAALLAGDDARAVALSDVQRMTTASAWIEAHPDAVAAEHAVMMRHDPDLLVRALDAAVLARDDIRHLFDAIRAPVAVLSGAIDQATPSALGEEIAAGLAKGQHHLVTDAAHHLPTEAPEIVMQAIAK